MRAPNELKRKAQHGHDFDGRHHRVGYHHADGYRGGFVYLHHGYPASPLGPGRSGLRGLGHQVDNPPDETRSLVQLKKLVAGAALGLGLLFCLPSEAATIYDNLDDSACSNNMVAGYYTGYGHEWSTFDWTPGADYSITTVTLRENISTPPEDLQEQTLNVTTDGGSFQATSTVGHSPASYTAFVFDPPITGGGTWSFALSSGAGSNYEVFYSTTGTGGALSHATNHWDGSGGGSVDLGAYPRLKLEGATLATTSTASIQTELPTSTYGGTYAGLLPTITFSSSTPLVSGGVFVDSFDGIMGSASSSWPFCTVRPWFGLFDMLQGFTKNEQTGGGLVLSGGLIPATTTLELTSASSTFAAIGVRNSTDILWPTLEIFLWLMFGLMVWRDLTGIGMGQGQDNL